MAQPAAESRKRPLYVDAFWEKPTVTPPLSLDVGIVGERRGSTRNPVEWTTFYSTIPTRTGVRGTCEEPYTSNRKGPKNSQSAIKGKLAKSM